MFIQHFKRRGRNFAYRLNSREAFGAAIILAGGDAGRGLRRRAQPARRRRDALQKK
jgi:hypothetical protein